MNSTDACEGTRTLLESCGAKSEGTDACGDRSECTDGCDGRPPPPPPPPSKPPSPHYLHFERRLASFEGWPMQMNQTAKEMAHAGFVYTQSADGVYCFHCGVQLRRWAPNDDPWLVHLKWSSHCAYLKLTRLVRHKKKNVAATTYWHYLCEENENEEAFPPS